MLIPYPKGNHAIVRDLIASIQNKTDVHAYLFAGPSGLLKRETARYFAAALLCEGDTTPPCGSCDNCLQSASGNNPDLLVKSLQALTSKKSIGVDEVREIIEDVYTRPFKARKKVYIIEDGEALTVGAQNALLKVLEEPPAYAVFILCTSDADKILPTIRSRSRILRFQPKSDNEIRLYVKENYPHMLSQADFIVSFCGGITRKVDLLCQNEDFAQMRQKMYNAAAILLRGGKPTRLFDIADYFDAHKKSKDNPTDGIAILLDCLLSFFSDLLKLKLGTQNGITNTDYMENLTQLCNFCSKEKLVFACESVIQAQDKLSIFVSAKSTILRMLLEIYYK